MGEGHRPSQCPNYRTSDQRRSRLREQGRCQRCAREGHNESACPSTAACFRCRGPHHVLVCPQTPEKEKGWIGKGSNSVPLGERQPDGTHRSNKLPSASFPPPLFPKSPQVTSSVTAPPSTDQRPSAYLMIREIPIFNHNGTHPVRVPVFFDPGSQPSFISADLVAEIRPPLKADEHMTVGGFTGDSAPNFLKFNSPRFTIRLQRKDGGWEEVELNQTPKIVPPVEYLKEISENWVHPSEMGVTVQEPKILLGIRDFWRFVYARQEIFPGLFRVSTVFGDIFGGEIDHPPPESYHPPPLCSPLICSAIVEQVVQKLWALDAVGICDPPGKIGRAHV